MDIDKLIASVRAAMAPKLTERKALKEKIDAVRTTCAAEDRDPSEDEAREVTEAAEKIRALDSDLEAQTARVTELEDEKRRDEIAARLSREVHPVSEQEDRGGYESQTRVTSEARTYRPDNDKRGKQFLRDVAAASVSGDLGARERLARHMQEERVERGADMLDRAAGTGAFAGLVVPQYLVDLVAPAAKAGRPFADACRPHDLPDNGMTVNLSKITTQTSTALQSSENTGVSETDIDDTLLTINVQTNAGQQTISRQAIERGAGVEDTTLEDLFRSYNTTLDGTLLNQATTGLSAAATAITYTDGDPSAAELYPKLLQGPAAVEAALLDQAMGDTMAVMHSRRWYWIQSQLGSTWPLFGQPGVAAQNAGANYGERYGAGVRGVLPNGTPVIVDNNIATNLGAGTNQDEIYFVAQSEAHLWEDANAPMLIRAEQTKAASLGVLFVVYGYFAYTFTRRAHAQKIGGTGLVTPTF